MTQISEAAIREALATIAVPGHDGDPVSLGMVSGLVVKDGNVGFTIEIDAAEGQAMEALRKTCEATVHALAGVVSVTAVLTAERRSRGGPAEAAAATPSKPGIPGVGTIVAVASGKGGVGKSTVAVNLALAMAANGQRVGLLDADIYGPSQPRMLGLSGRPHSPDGRLLEPMTAYGIVCMSMGFLSVRVAIGD